MFGLACRIDDREMRNETHNEPGHQNNSASTGTGVGVEVEVEVEVGAGQRKGKTENCGQRVYLYL